MLAFSWRKLNVAIELGYHYLLCQNPHRAFPNTTHATNLTDMQISTAKGEVCISSYS